MLEAIAKQHVNKAANGDSKAATLVVNLFKENKPGIGDSLSELVQEFRAVHNRHMATAGDRSEIGKGEGKGEDENEEQG
jgi:hypothetical protein